MVKRFFDRQAMHFKLIMFELVVTAIILVTLGAIYFNVRSDIYDKNTLYVEEILAGMEQNISTHFSIIESMLYSVTYNSDVQEFILEEDPYIKYESWSKVEDHIIQMETMKPEIIDIIVIGKGGNTYNLGYDQVRNSQIEALVPNIKGGTKAQYLGIIEYEDQKFILFGNSIYAYRNGILLTEEIGYMLALVSPSMLELDSGNKSAKGLDVSYYILDRDENVLTGKPSEYEEAISGLHSNEYILYNRYIEAIDSEIIGIIAKEKLFSDIDSVWPLYLIIFVVMLGISTATYIFLNAYIVKPLDKLTGFIVSINSGKLSNLKQRIEIKGGKEIECIADEFNRLLDEIIDLTKRLFSTTSHLYEVELAKKEAELNLLKSQINPHFLYNTLGIIKGMAMVKREEEIEKIASSLAKIFRYSIKGDDLISISRELEIIESYIYIQQTRFKDRFDVFYEIPESLKKNRILKMIIQPLVENAVSHGIEQTMRKCTLRIGCSIDEASHRMFITVSDDGVGIKAPVLEEINNMLETSDATFRKEHLGIMNVHERIQHVYGKDQGYGLRYESHEDQGTVVTVTIPYNNIRQEKDVSDV